MTARVRDSSRDITAGSASIRDDMGTLRDLSERLKESLAAIEGEAGTIRRTTEGMRDSGTRNAELVSGLRSLIDRFTVDKEEGKE